ncbi:hypothetical protein HZA76_02950 [Candidatus Roizmanbacteria bacterium]|nr:hypothetical protein [Candidatus Roizmanbacteria bacterium]
MKKLRVLIVVGLLAAALALVGRSVVAGNSHSGGTRPGWGNGDDNHTHTGPPGNSVKPGWGFGDDHHTHTGPPGHSELPEHEDDEEENED